jgi:hypothetical protein
MCLLRYRLTTRPVDSEHFARLCNQRPQNCSNLATDRLAQRFATLDDACNASDMAQSTQRVGRTLRAKPTIIQWGVLLTASLAFIVPLQLIHLPAALLLGAMAAAILVAVFEGKLAVPRWPYVIAQGLIGCLVARSIGPAILTTMVRHWPLFLAGVCSVLIVSTTLGALLARWKVLPGTTAV